MNEFDIVIEIHTELREDQAEQLNDYKMQLEAMGLRVYVGAPPPKPRP